MGRQSSWSCGLCVKSRIAVHASEEVVDTEIGEEDAEEGEDEVEMEEARGAKEM